MKKDNFFIAAASAACIASALFLLAGAPENLAGFRALRLAAGFLVGGALALAGSISQTIFRNALATPYTLGVSSGAAVGAGAAICWMPFPALFSVPCGAFCGAALTFLLVLWIGRFGKSSAAELLLGGIIVGTVLSGVLIYLVSSADRDELANLSWWMLGDLSTIDPPCLALLAAAALVALGVSRVYANDLNAMTFGDEGAAFLGVSVTKTRLVLLSAATLLVSLAVAFAGIIGFVGLIVPHVVRKIRGSDQRGMGLAVYLAGGLFLMLCDGCGRLFDPVRRLPAGLFTAVAGGICFLILLRRRAGRKLR